MSENVTENKITVSQLSNNTKMYLDHVMAQEIMKISCKVFESDNIFSLNNIIKIICLTSLDEIKSLFKSYLKYLLEYVKTNYHTIYKYMISSIKFIFGGFICYTYSLIKKFCQKITDKKQNEMIEGPISSPTFITTEMKYDELFLKMLHKYILDNKNTCQYTIYNDNSVTIKNLEEFEYTEKWGNIRIEYDDYKIFLEKKINFTFTKKNGENIIKGNSYDNKILSPRNVKCMCDCVPEANKAAMAKLHSRTLTLKRSFTTGTTDDHVDNYYYSVGQLNFATGTIVKSKYTRTVGSHDSINIARLIASSLHMEYKNIDYFQMLVELTMLLDVSYNFFTGKALYWGILDKIILFDMSFPIKNNIMSSINYAYLVDKSKLIFGHSLPEYNFVTMLQNENTTVEPLKINENLIFHLEAPQHTTENELYHKFLNFVGMIMAKKVFNAKEIYKFKIYRLLIDKNATVEYVDNPEYLDFCDKQKDFANMQNDNNDTDNDNEKEKPDQSAKIHQLQFLRHSPPKKIKQIINTLKINTILNSENKYKSLDTLYLRESDQYKLLKVLYNYENNGGRMQELGIQHKLNIIFYGKPGTGKTTTTWAIASYLKKDLYYVKINDRTTCNEFMKIIEHVLKTCENGGIIILEEIDVMCKLFHKRENQIKEFTNTETMDCENDLLTLEFVLNVLQGQLTPDGLVVIATTTSLDSLDGAFYRVGRFDLILELKLCDHHQIAKIFKKFYGREIKLNVLEQIPENVFEPVKIITICSNYYGSDCADEEIMAEFMNRS